MFRFKMKSTTVAIVLTALFSACMGSKRVNVHYDHQKHDDNECATEKCIELPRATAMSNIEEMVSQPPRYFIYSLSHDFDCAVVSTVKPPSGTTCFGGESHITPTNSTSLRAMKLTFCEDNQPCLTALDSKTGLSKTWFTWDYEFTEQCSWTCAYTCTSDGEKFQDFVCTASNDNALDKIEQIVSVAKRCICNGRHIHDAREGCPEVSNCPIS